MSALIQFICAVSFLWLVKFAKCSEIQTCSSSEPFSPIPITNSNSANEIFLYKAILKEANSNNVNHQCLEEIQRIWQGMEDNQLWALKALDASGNYQSGFMMGNNHWPGSKSLCDNLKKPIHVNYAKRFPRIMREDLLSTVAPFDFNYKTVYVKHHSSYQFEMKFLAEMILQVGLCTPKSCSNDEIANLTRLHFDAKSDDLEKTFQFKGKVLHAKTLELEKDFTNKTGYRLLRLLTLVTAFMSALSFFYNRRQRNVPKEQTNNNNHHETENKTEKVESNSSLMMNKMINCFSIPDNFKAIWSRNEPPESISVINGIRSIGCNEILCFHVNWFMFYTSNNPTLFFHYAENPLLSPISNAALLVDAFFSISGFLHTYNFFRNTKFTEKVRLNGFSENVKIIGKLLLNRYIRLAVAHHIMILLTEVGNSYIASTSPFYSHDRNDLTCQKYWWRNILFIQNLFDQDELCVSWTWSTACEMQYYTIFTVGLFLYTKKPELMKKAFVVLAALIAIVSTKICFNYEFQVTFDLLFETGTALYIAPWSRFHPYISGAFVGWLITHYDLKSKLSLIHRKWIRYTSFFVIIGCLYLTYNRGMHWFVQSILLCLVRYSFGLAIAAIVVLNLWKEKSAVMDFLSCGFFVHVNKLSYFIYLINPLVITMFYGMRDQGSHIDPWMYIHDTVGMLVIVYFISFALTLFFEVPYSKLLTLLTVKNSALRK